MKTIGNLFLGSAAILVAASGAQAADLPVKAKAVEYVKVCSLYGPGFYYIPGTDTCIKLSGYLRAEVVANSNSDFSGPFAGAGGAQNRFTNGYTWRSREDLSIDTRTATEWGVVRTYFDSTFSWTTDSYGGGSTPGGTVYAPLGTTPVVSAPGNGTGGGIGGGSLGVYIAFIQFAGFTIGKAVSQFAAPWVNYPANSFDGLVGGISTVTGVNQFSYTAQFGNGVSLTLSAQDQTLYTQAGVMNLGAPGTAALGPYGVSDYAGTIAPDLIAMLRVDQAWGLFQASFAAHDNHAAYYGASEVTGHPDDKWGWAGALALSIKNIPTGPGDTVNLQGVYTNGATRYNIQDLSYAGAPQLFGNTGIAGAYQSIGLGLAPDSVFVTGGQQQLVSTWGFRGAYVHNWNPYWNTSIYGAYGGVMYNSTAKTYICGPAGKGVGGSFAALLTGAGAGLTSCNPNYNIAQLGTQTQWTPIKNLTLTADFNWSRLDQKYAGEISYGGSGSIGKPAALYELKDQDSFTLLLRAQRNW